MSLKFIDLSTLNEGEEKGRREVKEIEEMTVTTAL
jgi:hypothetical protein